MCITLTLPLLQVGPTVSAWATAGRLPLLNDDVHAYDMDRLRWALGIVLSRAHAVNVKSARDKQLVMLPVVDMLNHRCVQSHIHLFMPTE